MKRTPRFLANTMKSFLDWDLNLSNQTRDMQLLKTCQWRSVWDKQLTETETKKENISQSQKS